MIRRRPPAPPYAGTIALTTEPTTAHCVLTNTATNAPIAEVNTPATIPLPAAPPSSPPSAPPPAA